MTDSPDEPWQPTFWPPAGNGLQEGGALWYLSAQFPEPYKHACLRLATETGIASGLRLTWALGGSQVYFGKIKDLVGELAESYDLRPPHDDDTSPHDADAYEAAYRRARAGLEEQAAEALTDPLERMHRVEELLLSLYPTHPHGDPHELHSNYVRDVAGELEQTFRLRFAARLADACQALIDPILERFDDHTGKREPYTPVQRGETIHDFWSPRKQDGMLWLDKLGLDWLHDWTGGAFDYEQEAERARTRWQNDSNSLEVLRFWFRPQRYIPYKLKPIETLAEYLWENEFREDWKRRQNKQRAKLNGTRYGDNQDAFAKMDKTMGAIPTKGRLSYQRDGDTEPVDVEDASDLEIDDERFTNAPGVLRMIPQQWGVAQHNEHSKPSAIQLPMGIDPEDGASVAFRLFADSQVQLAPKAAKIAVGLHLLSPQNGGLGSVELGELTAWVNQGISRPAQKRERETVRNNLVAVRSLGVPPNLDGTGRNIQMFEIHPPDSLDKDAEVVFGHTRGFEQFLREVKTTDGPLRSLNGSFILNADGFMRISGNDSDAARMYLTLCALWNDHGWNPNRIPFRSIDELARRANQLSEQARRALTGEGTDRDQLRQGRHQTRKVLEKLIDKYGLVDTLDEKIRRKVKILPNERHREAWNHLRGGRDQKIDLDDS